MNRFIRIYLSYMTIAISGMLIISIILFFYSGVTSGDITLTPIVTGIICGLLTMAMTHYVIPYYSWKKLESFRIDNFSDNKISDFTNFRVLNTKIEIEPGVEARLIDKEWVVIDWNRGTIEKKETREVEKVRLEIASEVVKNWKEQKLSQVSNADVSSKEKTGQESK